MHFHAVCSLAMVSYWNIYVSIYLLQDSYMYIGTHFLLLNEVYVLFPLCEIRATVLKGLDFCYPAEINISNKRLIRSLECYLLLQKAISYKSETYSVKS